jgi:hypothetical protein
VPRSPDPNSRTTPVTIKVSRQEAEQLRRLGGGTSAGKGLRKALERYWSLSMLRSNE